MSAALALGDALGVPPLAMADCCRVIEAVMVHPTPKPLDAYRHPDGASTVARGGLCYEPFCGSGSQIVAGEANGRRVFAMENQPGLCRCRRVGRADGDPREAILDADGRSFAAIRGATSGW